MKSVALPLALLLSLTIRTLGVTFTVNQSADQADPSINDGRADIDLAAPGDQTTLRAAIQEANKQAGSHSIVFSGVAEITPSNSDNRLPVITNRVTIDGGSTRVDIHSSSNITNSFTLAGAITDGGLPAISNVIFCARSPEGLVRLNAGISIAQAEGNMIGGPEVRMWA